MGSTDRLACYAAWFLSGRFAGCWSSWCQTPHPQRVSTRATEHHTTCGTDEAAYPAGTPGLPQFSYTSHSWQTEKYKWDIGSHLYVFTCRAEILFWNTADEERYTRLPLPFLQGWTSDELQILKNGIWLKSHPESRMDPHKYLPFKLNVLTVHSYQFAWLHFLKEKVNWFSQLSLASAGVTWERVTHITPKSAKS